MFCNLEPIQFCSSLSKTEENCFVMLGQARATLRWSRPNDLVPKEEAYGYPTPSTRCAQKLAYFSPLLQSMQWKILPPPTSIALLIPGEYHAQNTITRRWKCRQELLNCSSINPLSSLFTAAPVCVCHNVVATHWPLEYAYSLNELLGIAWQVSPDSIYAACKCLK